MSLRQSGLPRRCAPRNDGGVRQAVPCRRYAPRNDGGVRHTVPRRRYALRCEGGARQAVSRRRCAPRNDGMARSPVGAACGREQTPPAPSTPSFALAERSYPSTTAASPNGLLIPTVSLVKESP